MSNDIQVVAIPQNASAMVYWTAPSNISVSYYKLVSYPDNQILYILGDTLIAEVFSLINGYSYTFQIVFVDIDGNESKPSTPSNTVVPFLKSRPLPPTNVTAIAKNASAVVSWSAPSYDGGCPILEYKVISVPDNQVIYTKSLTATIFSLINGVSYKFYVIASNIIGDSKVSKESNDVVPNFLNIPNAPLHVTAVFDELTSSILVSWSEPNMYESFILDYKVISIYDDQVFFTKDLFFTISNLKRNTSYGFYVIARNIIGNSHVSELSNIIITPDIPDPPQSLSFTLGNLSSTVSWLAPVNDGGESIKEYQLVLSPGNIIISVPSASLSHTFYNLIYNQSYSVSIQAVNYMGSSDVASISFVAVSVPETPTNLRIIYESIDCTEVILEWDPAVTSGDFPVIQYFIRSNPYYYVYPVDGNTTMVHITGLYPHSGYNFSVYAVNTFGFSLPSNTTQQTKFISLPPPVIYYKKLKTGGNDPSLTKSQKYSMYIKSSLKYQAVNTGGGTFIS